jgi:hypothetical protein
MCLEIFIQAAGSALILKLKNFSMGDDGMVCRDDDMVCREVKATMAFVVLRETKKDAFSRARSMFMRHGV